MIMHTRCIYVTALHVVCVCCVHKISYGKYKIKKNMQNRLHLNSVSTFKIEYIANTRDAICAP